MSPLYYCLFNVSRQRLRSLWSPCLQGPQLNTDPILPLPPTTSRWAVCVSVCVWEITQMFLHTSSPSTHTNKGTFYRNQKKRRQCCQLAGHHTSCWPLSWSGLGWLCGLFCLVWIYLVFFLFNSVLIMSFWGFVFSCCFISSSVSVFCLTFSILSHLPTLLLPHLLFSYPTPVGLCLVFYSLLKIVSFRVHLCLTLSLFPCLLFPYRLLSYSTYVSLSTVCFRCVFSALSCPWLSSSAVFCHLLSP